MSTTMLEMLLQFKGKELLTEAEAPAANSQAERTLFTGKKQAKKTLNATSTPKVDGPIIAREVTLAGPLTIDFSAALALTLPGAASRTVDVTGKRLKAFFLRCAVGNNAAGVTIAPGAANPYPVFGAARTIVLGKGRIECGGFDAIESDLPTVAVGARTIDITPGAAGDILYYEFHFGTP